MTIKSPSIPQTDDVQTQREKEPNTTHEDEESVTVPAESVSSGNSVHIVSETAPDILYQRTPRFYKHLDDVSDLKDTSFSTKVELTADYQGSSIAAVSDEYFGSASNLIKTTKTKTPPLKKAGENEEDGEQDGWLVKRHLKDAYVKIDLGAKGTTCGVDIDTAGYIQCAPSFVVIYGRLVEQPGRWTKLLTKVPVKPNSHNFFEIRENDDVYDQVLAIMEPGGGIHRLRIYGDIVPPSFSSSAIVNLSSTILGSQIINKPRDLLNGDTPKLLLERSDSSDDGWITPRNQSDRQEYTIIKLALEGIVDRIIIDTTHFIGNAPKAVLLQGCCIVNNQKSDIATLLNDATWVNLVDDNDADLENIYPNMFHVIPCVYRGPLTHVRILPLPDGGIQQLLLKGRVYNRNSLPFSENNKAPPNNDRKRKHNSEKQPNSNKRVYATRSSQKATANMGPVSE